MYEYKWDSRYMPGYVVYRKRPENKQGPLSKWIDVHKVALFVTEEEAKEYCDHRNSEAIKNKSDAVSLIEHG